MEQSLPSIRRAAAKLIGRAGYTRADREDVENDFVADLLHRLPRFDPRRATLGTFVRRVIENRLATALRDARAQKRDFCRNAGSLNRDFRDEDGRAVDRSQTIPQDATAKRTGRTTRTEIDLSDLQQDMIAARSTLPKDLQELFDKLRDHSLSAIARERGVTWRRVRRDVDRLQDHLRDLDLRGYLEN